MGGGGAAPGGGVSINVACHHCDLEVVSDIIKNNPQAVFAYDNMVCFSLLFHSLPLLIHLLPFSFFFFPFLTFSFPFLLSFSYREQGLSTLLVLEGGWILPNYLLIMELTLRMLSFSFSFSLFPFLFFFDSFYVG